MRLALIAILNWDVFQGPTMSISDKHWSQPVVTRRIPCGSSFQESQTLLHFSLSTLQQQSFLTYECRRKRGHQIHFPPGFGLTFCTPVLSLGVLIAVFLLHKNIATHSSKSDPYPGHQANEKVNSEWHRAATCEGEGGEGFSRVWQEAPLSKVFWSLKKKKRRRRRCSIRKELARIIAPISIIGTSLGITGTKELEDWKWYIHLLPVSTRPTQGRKGERAIWPFWPFVKVKLKREL